MSEQQVGGAAEGPAVVWAAGAEAVSGSEVAGRGAPPGPAESQPGGAALHWSLTLAEKRHNNQNLLFDSTVNTFLLVPFKPTQVDTFRLFFVLLLS